MAQEFGRVPSEAGSDLTDGVDSKSAGLSERLHGGTLVVSDCLGKYKGQVNSCQKKKEVNPVDSVSFDAAA